MQYVTIPQPEWKRIVRILDTLAPAESLKPATTKAEWISLSEFRVRSGKSPEQWRYLREVTAPELFRVKPGSTQYQINYTAYLKLQP
jgi:hypothetical protein